MGDKRRGRGTETEADVVVGAVDELSWGLELDGKATGRGWMTAVDADRGKDKGKQSSILDSQITSKSAPLTR